MNTINQTLFFFALICFSCCLKTQNMLNLSLKNKSTDTILENYDSLCETVSLNKFILNSLCGKKKTDINLNSCLANIDGKLTFMKDGFYSNSCTNCRINKKIGNPINTNFLKCTCLNMRNVKNTSEIKLSDVIVFDDNELKCNFQDLETSKYLTPSDNFRVLCNKLIISDKINIFKAFCGKKNIEYDLDLNKCIANIDGTLRIRKNGNYGLSCKNCILKKDVKDQNILACTCNRANNRYWNDSIISLQERIIYNKKENTLQCLSDQELPEEKTVSSCLTIK
jgi:hypothetical protein